LYQKATKEKDKRNKGRGADEKRNKGSPNVRKGRKNVATTAKKNLLASGGERDRVSCRGGKTKRKSWSGEDVHWLYGQKNRRIKLNRRRKKSGAIKGANPCRKERYDSARQRKR